MSTLFHNARWSLLSAAVLLTTASAQSQPISTVTGNIADLANGWGQEGYYITLKNVSGTSGCANPLLFVALPARADQKYIVANAMLAMSTGAKIQMYSQGCVLDGVASIIGLRVFSN